MNIEQTDKHLTAGLELLRDSQSEATKRVNDALDRFSKMPNSFCRTDSFRNRMKLSADYFREHAKRCNSFADEIERLTGSLEG